MTAKKSPLRLAAVLAALAAALVPRTADSVCEEDAARNLLATSYLDSVLNPPDGEDREFLYREAGFPNILVLFDSSSSMRRLPPNGPAFIGGLNPTLPPGVLLANPESDADQTAALATPRIVGCGRDPVSAAAAGFMTSDVLQGISQRRFHSACGTATNPALIGATYQGHATDYAASVTVCPYYTSSNSQATGASGFDPNFYNGATGTDTVKNGSPVFFAKDLIFHDTVVGAPTYAFSNTLTTRHNFGDGWTDEAVYPWRTSTNQLGSISTFCSAQGSTLQGAFTREQICNTCLTQAGWYYDGIILQETQDGIADKQYPSIWYSGNYLNFFPPKFLVARKVVKDLIAVQSKIRMALARFDASGASFFKEFNPSCGMPDGSSFDSNRGSYISDLNSPGKLNFTDGTPLSRALFDVGRYYHSPDLPWFGAAFEDTAKESPGTKNQYAVCYSCQVSTAIVLTDGVPSPNDGATTLPSGSTTIAQTSGKYGGDVATGILGIDTAACPQCDSFSGAEDYLDNLPKVAWYLHNMDLRKNDEATEDCKRMGGKQTIQTYTVGFATGQLPNANTILRNAAQAGGGIFVGAEDPSQLRDGIQHILREISTRSTSFSVATVSTLQTTSGRAVIVPRFDPNKTAFWPGHLFRFDLYSEFVNKCTPGGVGDLDCDGRCTSAFLHDNSGSDSTLSLVSEDSNGIFVRNDPKDKALCEQAPACGVASCSVPGNEEAVPFWDAGKELAETSWKDRNVWTVVDSNGDGRIDATDTMVKLDTSTDAAASAIVPYLGLGTSATGASVCGDVANLLTNAGDLDSAARVTTSKTECAKTIIRFLLGADVLNEQGKKAPEWPPADQESLWDRKYKLGDIFHSSPVVVDPPLPRDGILCPNGLSNQCMSSLWGTPTLDGETGYDGYSKSAEYRNRRKIILVGANDGLLHAFNGGEWKGNPTPGQHNAVADDPFTSAVDESLPPFNGYYERGNEDGAKELWAFLPPDLISKTPTLMTSRHHFFVDGTAMVRDVWVDGTENTIGAGTVDDRKEPGEFHTVAVVGERRGGTHYFALDITDATELGAQPAFLWIYPQPNDPESLTFGATYDDFLPVPPPVGPVRIQPDAARPQLTDTPEMAVEDVADPVAYHERWVAFLSGGYDPQYLRGRGVHMVDVWTGEELFDFSYPADPSAVNASDPRLALKFPIAATVGMVPWGQNAKRNSDEKNDRFFDTATFGDTGGQLWVIRFSIPGELGADGKVGNWYGARMFQMGGQGGCSFCGAQPFFNVTANMPLPSNLALRVFAGTGDRFNLLDRRGGTCGPDNLRACVMRGCTVTLAESSNFLQATDLGSAQRGLSQAACSGALTVSQTDGSVATCTVDGRVNVVISGCPGSLSTTKNVQAGCTEMADGYRCTTTAASYGQQLAIAETSPITVGNWFLSLLAFEESGARAIFTDELGARTYDGARLWITQTGITSSGVDATDGLELIPASDDAPANLATADSPGWGIYYDHEGITTIDTHRFTISWKDERTSSASATGEGLITWNTTQPTLAEVVSTSASCKASKCTAESRRVSYHYGANPETGAPYLGFTQGGAVVRAIKSYLLVPTQADQTTVFVNQKGQVAVGLTAVNPEKGATNVGMGEPLDPTSDLGFVEVSEELHACRHQDPPVCR